MGIRFEYGARKATNGPMIFFSDPISEINLKEEIRGAIGSRLSFYAYRMPGDSLISFGSSEGIVEGIGQPGFVIAPFLPDDIPYTIPYSHVPRIDYGRKYCFPDHSTTREEHQEEVNLIKDTLSPLGKGKTVATRVKIDYRSVDLGATFLSLAKAYPDAFIFCFATPATGAWIGATPELLLSVENGRLHTMALAGTMAADSEDSWDAKNIEEQRLVTEHILSTLSNHDIEATTSAPFSKYAGKIKHICTLIDAESVSTVFENPSGLQNLLSELSPTPAVCGSPKDTSLEIIRTSEKFPRAYYGGFCGPFHSERDFSFFVSLRCGQVEGDRYALYAGGGITLQSNPESEWIETEMKLSTLDSKIVYESYSYDETDD